MKISKLLAAGMFFGFLASASAQTFSDRPLKLVSIFAPGSATDVNARATAAKLGAQLKQTIIVENNPGGGGVLAMRSVLHAQPPGYTLLYSTNALMGNLHAYREPGYRLEDYALVGPAGMSAYELLAHTSVPARSIQELVAYAKANPGKLNYADTGPTTTSTTLFERLKGETGIDIIAIPYKGGEATAQALLNGEVQLNFVSAGTAQVRIRTGKVRGLAVSSDERSAMQQDIPTFKEQGYRTVALIGWHAIFVPSAAPAASVQRLQEAMARVNASPEMKEQMAKLQFEPWPGNNEAFMAYIRREGELVGQDFRRLQIPLIE